MYDLTYSLIALMGASGVRQISITKETHANLINSMKGLYIGDSEVNPNYLAGVEIYVYEAPV